jgi:FPC/CPF motif-containing protein YcgG
LSIGVRDEMSQEEWRQYFLPDNDPDIHHSCPLHHAEDRLIGAEP